MSDDEYYKFKREKGKLSGSIYPGYEVRKDPLDPGLLAVRECIICGNEITIYGGHVCADGSDLICPDCKEAILWAKKKMKEKDKKEEGK